MRPRVLALALVALVAVAAVGAPGGGSAQSAASRVIDRTLLCTPVVLYERIRDLDVFAAPRLVDPRLPGYFPGYARVGSGTDKPISDLVVLARPGIRFGNTRFLGAAYASSRRCVRARGTIPLSSAGLAGPPVVWEQDVSCEIRGRVLVRVRAVLRAPAAWQPLAPGWIGARGQLVEGSIAVRTERGRTPLAYVTVDGEGRTRFWSSGSCG